MATYYVSTAGNNGNAGTIGSPWRTIAFAATQAVAGDTVLIRGLGTNYVEALTNFPNAGTSYSNAITFANYPGETPTIACPAGLFGMFLGQTSHPQYIIFDGLIIDGSLATAYTIKFECGSTYNEDHIRFKNCTIYPPSNPGGGTGSTVIIINTVANQTGACDNEFLNCHVYGGGHVDNGSDHCFYISTSRNIIDGCNIDQPTAAGVQLWNEAVNVGSIPPANGANDNIIRNNYIHDGQTGVGVNARGWGIITGSGNTGNQLYNNLIVRCGQQPTSYSGGIAIISSDDTLVYNNTITACPTRGIGIEPGCTDTLVTNNIIYNNGNDNVDFGTGTVYTTNTISVDPDFVDPGNDNYRLQIGSVSIDQGTTLGLFNTDIAGITRPQGSAWDIGCYEQFNQSGSVFPIVSQDLPQNGGTTNPASTIGFDVLAVFVSWVGSLGGGINPSLSDSETNTWVSGTVYTPASNNIAGRWFYCINPSVDAAHTFTTSITSGYPSIVVVGFEGDWQFDAIVGSSAEATGTESAQAGSITPTNNGAIILHGLATNAFDFSTPQQNMAINGSYVVVASVQNLPGVSVGNFVAALEQTSIAATNPTWTWDVEAAIGASAIAFIPLNDGCADPVTLPQTFTGANGTPIEDINCNWVPIVGGFVVQTNSASGTLLGGDSVATWNVDYLPNQYAQIVVSGLKLDNYIGVALRVTNTAPLTGLILYTDGTRDQIVRFNSGTPTLVVDLASSFTNSDVLRGEARGQNVIMLKNGTAVPSATTTTGAINSGFIGISAYDSDLSSKGDDFNGGSLTSGGHSLLLLGVGA